jgi:hypothetical protein
MPVRVSEVGGRLVYHHAPTARPTINSSEIARSRRFMGV